MSDCIMQFRKWAHYLREREPRHLRVDGSSEPEPRSATWPPYKLAHHRVKVGAHGAESPLGRIMWQKQQWNLIPLIYTPAMTNEFTHVQQGAATSEESKPDPPATLGNSTKATSRNHGPGHYFSLARSRINTKEISHPREKSARTSPPTLPPTKPQARSKIIPL